MTTKQTPIEEKLQEKKETATAKTNNWEGFGRSLLSNLVITLFIGLAGSNFIYLTRMANEPISKSNKNSSVLDLLLPTNPSMYFPTQKNQEETNNYIKTLDSSLFTNCGNNNTCASAEACTHYKRLAAFIIGTLGGWPYSMRDPKVPSPIGLWSQFKYWIADSTADSYINNRTILHKICATFAPEKSGENMLANQPFQMFVIAPIMYLIIPLVMFFLYFSSIFSLFRTSPLWAISGLFLLYTFFISYGVSVVQFIQYIATLLLVPILADYKMVKNIFKCNGKALVYFFLFLTCTSAFANFDNTISITILVAYIAILVTGYW